MTIVTDGLQLYLNGKQNNAAAPMLSDLSGNGRDAEVIGPILQPDGSYLFDGVDDYMLLPVMPAMTSYTFEGWINYSKAATMYLLSYGSEANGFQIEHSTDLTNIRISQNGQSRSGGASTQNALGTMTYFAIVYNSDTKTAQRWVNNEELSSLEFLADMATDSGVAVIAKRNTTSTSSLFGGYLASLRVYNRALSEAELAQNKAVGVEVGMGGDSGTDVAYSFATKQAVYADQVQEIASKQTVYAPRQQTCASVQEVYVNRTQSAACAQTIFANLTYVALMNQGIFIDRAGSISLAQKVYADRNEPIATNQSVYENMHVLLGTIQRSYAERQDNLKLLQQVYFMQADLLASLQAVYADRAFTFPLLIRVFDPDAPTYEQTIYFGVRIKRQLVSSTQLRRYLSVKPTICRSKNFTIRL